MASVSTAAATCILLGLSLCVIISKVSAGGTIWLRFQKYENPSGRAANGHCCDGRWIFCQRDGCDYRFYICLGRGHSSETSAADCEYGRMRSKTVHNQANYVFGQQFGGIKNPMAFHFNKGLKMPVKLKVDVYDRDALSRDEFVASFVIQLASNHLRSTPSTLVMSGRTRLIATSRLVCDAGWFVPPNCDVACSAPTHSYMHFTCDPSTGKQVCNKGWTGYNCVLSLTGTPQSTTTSPQNASTTTPSIPVKFHDRVNADCDRLHMNNSAIQDGVYAVHAGELNPFPVFCDISDGGWTVIQQRVDGTESFYRGWDEYKKGFGVVGKDKDYWLGLEKIYHLTNQRSYKLRVTMQPGNGESRFAEYEHFWIEDEAHLYRLHVDGYSGNAGDAFLNAAFNGSRSHRLAPFSTFDRDNDNWTNGSCAAQYRSGWWFNDCYWANLNGPYVTGPNVNMTVCPDGLCVAWRTIPGYEEYSLHATKMEVLPNPRF